MKKRFPDSKMIYRLRDYAILEDGDGSYDYVAWEMDGKTKKLTWIMGKAVVLGNLLALTRIVSDGEETHFRDRKGVRKALKKLPPWGEKARYYCVIVDQAATTPCDCASGRPIDHTAESFKNIQDMLRGFGVLLTEPEPKKEEFKGIARAMVRQAPST